MPEIESLKPVNCGCGGEAFVSINGFIEYHVVCASCGLRTDWFRSKDKAIEAWNRAMGADKVDELMEHVWREELDTREKIAELVERMLR